MSLEIEKVLTLSTAHMTHADSEYLESLECKSEPRPFLFANYDYGYVVRAPSLKHEEFEIAFEDTSQEFRDVINFAAKEGCRWVCFDQDGPIIDDLPEFAW